MLRPVTEEDWPSIFDVAMQAVPDSKEENLEWWHNRQAIDERRQHRLHRVVENAQGDVVGYGAIEQGPEEDLYRMFIVASPDVVRRGLGDAVYAYLMRELERLGARIVWIREERRDPLGYWQWNARPTLKPTP